MEPLKEVHTSTRSLLHEWDNRPTQIVHITDLVHGISQWRENMTPICKYYVTLMCFEGDIVDYGDGLYGINEERTA